MLCNRCANAEKSSRKRCAIAAQSMRNRCAIDERSLRNRGVIQAQSLCDRCVIAAQSLCDRCVIAARSMRDRCAIDASYKLHNRRAVTANTANPRRRKCSRIEGDKILLSNIDEFGSDLEGIVQFRCKRYTTGRLPISSSSHFSCLGSMRACVPTLTFQDP
jgi:hypothetical protein